MIQKKIDEYSYKQNKSVSVNKKIDKNHRYYYHTNYYKWIEQILQTPFEDCRKIIVDLILAPYLINIKKLTYGDSYHIVRKWLDHCDSLKELDGSCNFNYRINYAFKTMIRKGIRPLSQYKIKSNSNYSILYILLKKKGSSNRKEEIYY